MLLKIKQLQHRDASKEILDDLHCEGEAVSQNLKELDVINSLLGGNAVSINALKKVLNTSSQKNWAIADLGCGSGQLMVEMNKTLLKKNRLGSFTGFDANPFMVHYAEEHCAEHRNIAVACFNVITESFKEDYDIVHASLFLHHFTETELVNLLQKISQHTRKAIIINDLHRHPLAYFSIKMLTSWFSKSYLVKHDAALSVAKGFKKKEWEAIFRAAGFKHWEMRWVWAFRHQIILKPIA